MMKIVTSDQFYSSLQKFTDLTCDLIARKELELLETCFDLAERLMIEGDPLVKNAIVGSYIPSLHSFLDDSALRTAVINLLPLLLRKEYDKQERSMHVKSDVSVFVICLN